MLCMVLLVLLCLVPTASSYFGCFHCEQMTDTKLDCIVPSTQWTTVNDCAPDSCYTVWGHLQIHGIMVPATQRHCNYNGVFPANQTCVDVINHPFLSVLKMNGTLCKCKGENCNNQKEAPLTTTTTTITTTTTTTTTTKATTAEFESTTDPDAPVASTNDWSLSFLTLLIVYCTFYVL
ncbi:unnamed protein product [Bursaphelenchus okinawaensis]|uniref:Protein quiver n=1 Tax=Bursaphelenchus okinawaensis TaxID=465554 RepID=A0A811K1W6_9BILA|nr:unnamed protein product [Bursaphelenchus okinawaensis]CAG9088639.1 unnamed protein product [Bursaphelenchus okinawaensis]